MAAAGFSRYSAAKGRQFRLALPQDDSNDSDDRQQYSGQVLFQRYIAQTRDTVERDEQSIDNNVEKGASRIHPNLSEYIRITHAIRDSASPRPKMYWTLKEICKKETGFETQDTSRNTPEITNYAVLKCSRLKISPIQRE